MFRIFLRVVFCVSLTAYAACAVSAEAWPSNAIKLIVTFPAGGSTDVTARLIAEKLRTELGRSIVVDNRPGAGGNIGADMVAKAAPDGYTLLMATSTHVTNRTLYKSLPYDFVQDLAPVSRIAFVPNLLVVNPAYTRAANLAEFIKLAKNTGVGARLNYGSGGNGTSHHLATALFNSMVGVEMEHVPYKGGAPAAAALLGGQVQVLFAPLVEVLSFVEAGKLKGLGVTTRQRSSLFPDIPAIGEMLPGYEVALWNGIVIPANTPADIVNKLNSAIIKALNQPDIKQKLAEQGSDPAGNSPAEFRQFIAGEVEKWAKIVRISGAKVD
ncbi:MAG TPA: tripartite tricarboxylate transporter substrate binding protein [Burkholderiales bacterium]|nr:tripartite tricarboxylate transporter substrate binding protein [Burkholderiales bacterium]